MTEAISRGVHLSSTAKLRNFGDIMKQHSKEFFKRLTAMICALMIAFLMWSCTRRVYVPVENTAVRTDTVYQAKLRVDSVVFRDSVAMIQRGDTVYMTKYRDRLRYRERIDTVYQSAVDSVKVSVPYPVERPLTKWEQTKMDFGGMFLGGLIAVVVSAVIVWIVKRKRRK